MHAVGMLELLDLSQRRVLQGVYNIALLMSEPQCLRALQELAGMGDGMRNIQRFERMPWSQ